MDEASTPVTVKSAFNSLKAAGYPRAYIEKLLPDWWDNSLFKTSAGALQFALILKQRLGLEARFGVDGELHIEANARGARFKQRTDTSEAELNVAAGLGLAISKLALFGAKTPYSAPSTNPQDLRDEILALSGKQYVDFEGVLKLCWAHGIPVLYLRDLPKSSKRMTGMAVSIGGRPVIVLGFSSPQHSRQLFVLAHELGHILKGHLGADGVLIDEDMAEVTDSLIEVSSQRKDAEEKEADAFALSLIRNGHSKPLASVGRLSSGTALAAKAVVLGRELGIDPGHLILSYAKEHNDWARANQALGYSPSRTSAIGVVEQYFLDGISLDELSGENKEYLLTIQGFGE